MSTVLLVRHGLTPDTGTVLTGRKPGVHLSDRGREQAAAVAARIAGIRLAAVVTSPLERCVETAEAVASAQRDAGAEPSWQQDDRLVEVGYGTWTARPLKELAKEKLWSTVQRHPAGVRFPEGEALAEAAARGVAAIRDWDRRLGDDAVWVACSHGDIIKAILADALGLHLDQFQRIAVDPCSVSVVRYTADRPFVLQTNSTDATLDGYAPKPTKRRGRRAASEATVGGGAGSGTT